MLLCIAKEMQPSRETIEKLCQRLRDYDPEIVEIIQFGSSVYIPELARDLDLLVFTREKKGDHSDYLGALDGLALPDVDIVVLEVGEPLKGLALGVAGAGRLLYGEGVCMSQSLRDFDPTFDEAWAALEGAKDYMRLAREAPDKLRKDRHTRNAFNELAHAARMASLAYLTKEDLGWKGIEDGLLSKYRRDFKEFFKILHVEYFYHGNYPMALEEEFSSWAKRVESYIKRLEVELGRGAGSQGR